jgi:hypothetical protein
MAAVTAANVTYVRGYERGDRNDKFVEKVLVFDVVFSANGATAADVPVALFGLTTITQARAIRTLVSTTNTWFVVQVNSAGTELNTFDPSTATDANRTAAANITGTVRIEVCGY